MDLRELARPPKQERSVRSIEQALAGSIDVIREVGWAGFTMSAVSRRAGVSVPLLHRRFGGKEDLFLAAQGRALEEMEADIACTYAGRHWEDLAPAETIELAVRGIAEIFARYGRLLRGFQERGVVDSRVRDRAETTIRLNHRLFSERILTFADEIAIERPQTGIDVCFASACASLIYAAKTRGLQSEAPDWDKLVSEIVDACSIYLLSPSNSLPAITNVHCPGPRGREPSTDPRELLLAGALELLTEGDYQGFTAVAVTSRARMAVGALYNCFENKDELVATVESRALDELSGDAQHVFGDAIAVEATGIDCVFAAVSALLGVMDNNRAAIRVLMARRAAGGVHDQASRVVADIQELFHRAIASHQRIHHPDSRLATNVCFLIVYSVLVEYIPHESYLTNGLTAGEFQVEQARLCCEYLNACATQHRMPHERDADLR